MNWKKYEKFKAGKYIRNSSQKVINFYKALSKLDPQNEKEIMLALADVDETRDLAEGLLALIIFLLGLACGGAIGIILTLEAML